VSALPLLIGALTFAAAYVLVQRRSTASDAARRVAAYVEPRVTTVAADEHGDGRALLRRVVARVEPQVVRLPGWPRVERLVERADVSLRPVELACAAAAGATVALLLLLAMGVGPATAIALVVLALLALRAYLGLRVGRRRRAFEEQLPELLTSLGSALRAGHGFNQALQSAAADAAEPAHTELQRVLAEARLGRPLEDALTDLAARLASADFDFVLDAVVVQRQVGGSLAGIFEIVGDAVRQRQQFALRLRALTAMGRMSAMVLIGLPFALGLLLTLCNHGYLLPLLESGVGRSLLVVSGVLMAFGAVWLRQIVSVKG
jgi:tight adherence protein B